MRLQRGLGEGGAQMMVEGSLAQAFVESVRSERVALIEPGGV